MNKLKFEKNGESVTVRYGGKMVFWFMSQYDVVRVVQTEKYKDLGISVKSKTFPSLWSNIFWIN